MKLASFTPPSSGRGAPIPGNARSSGFGRGAAISKFTRGARGRGSTTWGSAGQPPRGNMTLDLRAGQSSRGGLNQMLTSPQNPNPMPRATFNKPRGPMALKISPQLPRNGTQPESDESASKNLRADRFASKPENNRYMELKAQRGALMEKYIAEGKMDDPNEKYRLEDARDFVGECQDMCPEYERHEREYQKGLMEFEKLPDSEGVDHARAVKRFRRSAADDEKPLPCDVRPPDVLKRTLDYLVYDVLPTYGLQRTYAFLRDRMRAIRKDITLQNLRGPEAVVLFERIARYHLMCSQKLCETIDIKQEYEQLGKTLQSLMEFYNDLRDAGVFMPNEAEFRAYYVLHHAFNSEVQSSLEHKFRHDNILSDDHIRLAVRIRNHLPRLDLPSDDPDNLSLVGESAGEGAFEAYGIFFKILQDPSTPYLVACAVHPHFLIVRRHAYRHMMNAFYVFPNAPDTHTLVEGLVERLGYDDVEDARIDLDYYEIPVMEIDGHSYAQIGKVSQKGLNGKNTLVPGTFNDAKQVSLQSRVANRLIERKREYLSESDIIDGLDQGSQEGGLMDFERTTPVFNQANAPLGQPLQNHAAAFPSTTFGEPSMFHSQTTLMPAQAAPQFPSAIAKASPFQPQNVSSQFKQPSTQSATTIDSFSFLPKATPSAFQSPVLNRNASAFKPSLQAASFDQQPAQPSFNFTHSREAEEREGEASRAKELEEQHEAAALLAKQMEEEQNRRRELEELQAQQRAQQAADEEAALRASQAKAAEELENARERERQIALEREAAEQRARVAREREAALTNFVDKLLEETVMESLHEVGQHVLYRDYARSRWIRFAKVLPKLYAKAQAKQDAVELLLDLAGSEIASPRKAFKHQAAAPERFGALTPKNRDAELARACDEIAVQKYEAYRQIDLANVVHHILRRGTGGSAKTVYYKLCISAPPCFLHSSDKKRTSVQWLRAKLGGLKPNPSEASKTEELQRSRDTVMDGAFKWECWAVVRHVTELPSPLQRDDAKVLKGVNALLFQFDIFEPEVDPGFYFNKERDRFVNLVNSLPQQTLHQKIPILFVYWSVPQLSMAQVKSRTKRLFSLDHVLSGGPLSSIHWLEVEYDDNIANLQDVNTRLIKALQTLASQGSTNPEFNFVGLQGGDILGTALFPTHYKSQMDNVQSRFPHRMATILDRNIYTFNVIIQMYNDALDVLKLVLTGSEVADTNFPAYEFAFLRNGALDESTEGSTEVRVDWNDEERLQELRGLIDQLVLPFIHTEKMDLDAYGTSLAQGLREALRPLWAVYCAWIARVIANMPGKSTADVHSHYDQLFELFQRTSHVPACAIRFPFGEIAEIVIRTTFTPLHDAFSQKYHLTPYLKNVAVSALGDYDEAMTVIRDYWYKTHVTTWIDQEEMPEYQSDEESYNTEEDDSALDEYDGIPDAYSRVEPLPDDFEFTDEMQEHYRKRRRAFEDTPNSVEQDRYPDFENTGQFNGAVTDAEPRAPMHKSRRISQILRKPKSDQIVDLESAAFGSSASRPFAKHHTALNQPHGTSPSRYGRSVDFMPRYSMRTMGAYDEDPDALCDMFPSDDEEPPLISEEDARELENIGLSDVEEAHDIDQSYDLSFRHPRAYGR